MCLVCAVCSATGLMTGAERLARRRQSRAYKQAMSNISLQFINGFLAEQPPTSPTVRDKVRDIDASGLGDESHFSLLWLLPGFVLCLLAITLYLAVSQPNTHRHHHHHTEQAGSLLV